MTEISFELETILWTLMAQSYIFEFVNLFCYNATLELLSTVNILISLLILIIIFFAKISILFKELFLWGCEKHA